jgi:hypothetical protein
MREWPSAAQWFKQMRRASALAQELRSQLPIFRRDDEPLIALLDERVAAWTAFAVREPRAEKNRPQDHRLMEMCWFVVEALDAAKVPLDDTRNGAVTEVLGLICRWAQRRPTADWSSTRRDHERCRAILAEKRDRSPKSR